MPFGAALLVYVRPNVVGNQFRIAGQPGAEVSWQVTGIRRDQYAEQHRIPVEQPKEPQNRGRYPTPTAFGLPESRGIGFQALASRPAPVATAGH
ncbi:hypothetical protein [Hymenobacter sp.]|uniref:hypothetical protein n=1 Tax=Hymenobacter sp. TaxID=1898978 RepID=UPI00286C0CBB|nr:hypothetical protein [Hymenobacter sp.]